MRRTCRWLARKMRRSHQQHAAAGSADGFERMILAPLARRFAKPRCLERAAAAYVSLAVAMSISVLAEQPAFAASDAAPSSSTALPASAASRTPPASSAHAVSGASAAAPTSAASHANHAESASATSGASAASAASAAAPASAASGTPASEAEPPPPTPPRRHPPLSVEEAQNATTRALDMRKRFTQEVTRRLNVPANEQRAYGDRLQKALADADLGDLAGEYVVMVDRAPNVQALFVYFRATPANAWLMIGASPVGTGLPGQYDHFLTPLGVFHHSPDTMDFRAEGTTNENGIRGYGHRDMRIYDFGWVDGERGWGKGGVSPMRFQMHATDPDRLEALLGIRHSKGCVRIPASLNTFLDQHGLLDDDYQARVEAGKSLWVLRRDRDVTPIAGRYLVVIDSARKTRPAWSPMPGRGAWSKLPKGGDTAD
ncbi:L,D-transpeptidase [Burkholderia sp. BCC0398]|uniref:L,D-transpeptidase n=1 Tax=Burkholderia sp. BCC0398 TaxID=2676297 RepID=UPI00158B9965|nr:L,D-transpeptidase [Burkholderia sp. BCC0398]